MFNLFINKLYFIYFFIALRFVDLITTNITITYMGAYEANPIAASILNNYGWYGITILIITICLTAIVSVYIIPKAIWRKVTYLMWGLGILSIIGPIMNTRIILYKLGVINTW